MMNRSGNWVAQATPPALSPNPKELDQPLTDAEKIMDPSGR